MTELERIDAALRTQLDVLRHSAYVEGAIVRLIEQMRDELVSKLATANLTNWSKARLNQLLRDSEALITLYYTQAQSALAPTYTLVANVAAAQTATGIVGATLPSKAVLESLVGNVLIDGATTKLWWEKLGQDTAFRFKSAIRQGIVQGETQAQLFKRVNEIAALAGRNSKALVHTSVMQTLNDATVAVLERNADLTPTTRHLATLDSSTCVTCGVRDGLEWDTLTHEPIGHDLPYTVAPLHFGCRCKMVGVTKIDKFAQGQRASMFGPVDRKVKFGDFLARQTQAFQEDVLGKGRAELFRSGKLTLKDLVSGNGSPLTLIQLEKRYAK